MLTHDTLAELAGDTNLFSFTRMLQSPQHAFTHLDTAVSQVKPNDCPIVAKFSSVETFAFSQKEVSMATFYAPHPLREFHKRSVKKLQDEHINDEKLSLANDQLAKIDSLPLLVFIHGLGGQMSQFEPLLQEFRNCSDIFTFDLPGFGLSKRPSRSSEGGIHFSSLSEFSIEDQDKLEKTSDALSWEDYKTDNIVNLIMTVLETKFPKRQIILIGHSMGTHISLQLAKKFPKGRVESLILLTPPKLSSVKPFDKLPIATKTFLNFSSYIPKMFDWYRVLDRSGGFNSKSVNAYIFNEKNDNEDDNTFKKLTQYRWNLDTDSETFLKYLKGFQSVTEDEFRGIIDNFNNEEGTTTRILIVGASNDLITPYQTCCDPMAQILKEAGIQYKYEIIDKANHSIFLDQPQILSGIVYDFVEDLKLNISCTWVLQVKALISGDKWGLKNKQKWDQVVTLSSHMISQSKGPSYILGMKTLRQSDPEHNPQKFERDHPEIYAVVDIGSDTPSYDPEEFQRIKYVKFKTESKVIPDNVTIVQFIDIVEKLMLEREADDQYVVVHCHYGQNRTGFLICCYLIEKLGWSTTDAINAFAQAKPPGIKHVHFRNALYLRYRK